MNFGFLVRCDEQGVTFHQVGEEPAGAPELLTEAIDENGRVVFLGRLYYLDELRGRLPGEYRPEPAACHAEHVLAAYRQEGVDGLAKLEGDYAFVLWDFRERLLLATRDPWGGFPLFWARAGNAVALSTAMRPLLDLLQKRTVSRDYLAEFLMLPGGGVQELHDERCAYEGVHRVVAGTRVEVRLDGTIRVSRWWDWAAQVEEPASLRLEDVAERFGALLSEAVRQRWVGRTAAHLSGGMDSTSVALLAARQARASGNEPVHGLSMVYERFAVLSRETPYIECALGEPGLQAHRLRGDDYLDFDGYRSEASPDEPVLSVCQSTANHALVEYAARLGARTLMTGFGADELVCLPPYQLHELLRSGRWVTAWRESARWARAHGSSRWRYLGPFGLVHFLPSAWQAGLACWWRGGQVAWERQRECTIAPWVRPEFARRCGLWQRAVERLRRTSHRCRPLALSVALESLDLNVGDAVRWELAVPRGLLTVHPYRDPRLVRFCLGWQGRMWIDPARQKPILADAMRDVLPAAIRERRRKGHFNEVFFTGLTRNLPVLESIVQRAPVDDLDLLDKGELLRCLHKAALGIGEDTLGVARLSLTLCVLKWLTTQQEALRWPGPAVWRF
jgi:asparagine synthase (glutamine-hydrolysing)